MKLFGALMLVAGFALSGALFAAEQATTTTKPATPACCKDECKKMGDGCCKVDANGKASCSMGGSCCNK